MSDVKIPEDVMETAKAALRATPSSTADAYVQTIARAILAERERAAKIAENWNYPPENTAHGIAQAIRSPHE